MISFRKYFTKNTSVMVLRRMLKFLFIAIVFAVPIFSRLFDHKNTKKSIIENTYLKYGRNANFTEKCIRVSSSIGVDVDFKKLESLYELYDECVREVGDYQQFGREFMEVDTNAWKVRSDSTFYLSDMHKMEMVTFLQTYCPKVIKFMKCDDVLSPIYEACYTSAERNETALGKAFWLQMFENLCENNVEQLVKVVNSKGLECGLSKGLSCNCNYRCISDPFSNPRLHSFCCFHNMTINCMGPVFKECGLSETPDTLMKSLFTNIQIEAICKDF